MHLQDSDDVGSGGRDRVVHDACAAHVQVCWINWLFSGSQDNGTRSLTLITVTIIA